MNTPFVAVLMGSASDLSIVEHTLTVLKKFSVTHEVKVTSAHRTPSQTHAYIQEAESRGCQVFICAAGLAAHLAGAVAANTTKPVIGIPVDGGPLKGHDALLSTVMMPGGIPVATVAIGKAGATNAGYLATQILAIANPQLQQRLQQERQEQAEKVMASDQQVQQQLNG